MYILITWRYLLWPLWVKKYSIGYKDFDCQIKPLGIILPKTRFYLKSYVDQNKWRAFWVEDDNQMIIIIFGIKSVMLSKENLTANLSILILFLKKKRKKKNVLTVMRPHTDFPDTKTPEAGSSYLRWSAILLLLFRKLKTIIKKQF